jgi:hypothetical protein
MPTSGRSDPGSGSGKSRYPGTFLLAFREAAAKLGWKIESWQGDAIVCQDGTGEPLVVGLENLYRRVRREQRSEWPAQIADFLRKVHVGGQMTDQNRDLIEVAEQLLLRLAPPFPALPETARVWNQPLDETGLVISLVIDHAETMSYVTEEMIEKSGQPGDHWLELALANLRQRTPQDCLELIHQESGIRLCALGDAYDSARALIVEPYLMVAPNGFFVGVPNRDELLVLPTTAEAMAGVHLLKLLALQNHQKAPYPVSSEVLWSYRGKWHRFPMDLKGNQLNIRPPAEFVEVLNELKPPDEDV